MKGPYQFKGDKLIHTPSGKVVGSVANELLTIFNPFGEAASVPAARREAMKALRKLQAQLNSKAILDQLGIC